MNVKSFVKLTPSVDFHTLFSTVVEVLVPFAATMYTASSAAKMSYGRTSSPPRSIFTAFTWWFWLTALNAAIGTMLYRSAPRM